MELTSIKSRLLLLHSGFGVLMLLIMVAIIPSRASKLATQVMEENTVFISRLLSDNLSLGI